jgi:hypothetical protein
MRKYDVSAEQVAGGSPDLAWLVAGEAGEGHFYSADDGLPSGIVAFPGRGHTSCFGSKAAVPSSQETRSSTSVRASRSPPRGYLTA